MTGVYHFTVSSNANVSWCLNYMWAMGTSEFSTAYISDTDATCGPYIIYIIPPKNQFKRSQVTRERANKAKHDYQEKIINIQVQLGGACVSLLNKHRDHNSTFLGSTRHALLGLLCILYWFFLLFFWYPFQPEKKKKGGVKIGQHLEHHNGRGLSCVSNKEGSQGPLSNDCFVVNFYSETGWWVLLQLGSRVTRLTRLQTLHLHGQVRSHSSRFIINPRVY